MLKPPSNSFTSLPHKKVRTTNLHSDYAIRRSNMRSLLALALATVLLAPAMSLAAGKTKKSSRSSSGHSKSHAVKHKKTP
jgi:hypothetical protein